MYARMRVRQLGPVATNQLVAGAAASMTGVRWVGLLVDWKVSWLVG